MNGKIITNKKEIKRVKTYIEGFDEHLEGGIPEDHIILISGTGGTMKSSLAFNILYNEALAGNVGIYITLEQSYYSLIKHVVNLDIDLTKINLVTLNDISKIDEAVAKLRAGKGGVLIDWLNGLKNLIRKAKEGANCRLLVLDSLSALYVLTKFEDPRTKLFFIFEFLRDLQLTSFLISEVQLNKNMITEFGVEEYLSDGIIHLQLKERYRKVTREISVIKMRATKCNNDIFSLEYKNRKFLALYGGKTPVL
jgi:KaiC/GvpD/RAD55 family RecA-like ATPase